MAKTYLDSVYEMTDGRAVHALYEDWADSYDTEIAASGYVTPTRLAEALASLVPEADRAGRTVLDYGCGTGLSGRALARAGFTRLHGCDPSPRMLARARERGLYERLWQIETEADGPEADGPRDPAYSIVAAVGVVSPGAAPADVLGRLAAMVAPGGLLAFSYNAHAMESADYTAALDRLLADERTRLRFREDGPHLPEIGLTATIFVVGQE